jgi:hypothetical protein
MRNEVRLFLKQNIILTLGLGVVVTILMVTMPPARITVTLPFILIFHAAIAFLSFALIIKKTESAPKKFVSVYLGNTTVKLLLFMAILFIYALSYLHDAVNFIISFFIIYIIYTIFEVVHLVKWNNRSPR